MAIQGNKLAELGLTLFVFILAVIVSWAFITPLVFAAIVAYFSYPIYQKLQKRFSTTISAVLISVFFIGLLSVIFNYGISFALSEVWNVYIAMAAKAEVMSQGTQEIIKFVANNVIGALSGVASQLPHIILSSFIFFISLFYFLKDGKQVINWLKNTLPLPHKKRLQVFKHIKQNVDAFVYVTFLIGLIQAIVAGVGFYIFGIGYPFLAGVVAGLLSLLPVIGPYFLYLTVGLLIFIAGNTTLAIGLILYGVIIGSILDYSARPVLMSRKAKLHPLIIFVGVFGGMSLMGLIGVIIGPIILSITFAFLKDMTVN